MKKDTENLTIPFKRVNDEIIIPKPSKKGDVGANAHIIGFKKIVNKYDKNELIEIHSDTYTLKPLERIGCSLGFTTAIPEGYYFKVVPRSGLAYFFD